MKNLITSHFIAMIIEILSSEHSIGDLERAMIESFVFQEFDKHGLKMSLNKIAKSLSKDADARIRVLGVTLSAA